MSSHRWVEIHGHSESCLTIQQSLIICSPLSRGWIVALKKSGFLSIPRFPLEHFQPKSQFTAPVLPFDWLPPVAPPPPGVELRCKTRHQTLCVSVFVPSIQHRANNISGPSSSLGGALSHCVLDVTFPVKLSTAPADVQQQQNLGVVVILMNSFFFFNCSLWKCYFFMCVSGFYTNSCLPNVRADTQLRLDASLRGHFAKRYLLWGGSNRESSPATHCECEVATVPTGSSCCQTTL